MKRLLFLFSMMLPGLAEHLMAARPVLDAEYGVGSWIWSPRTHDRQECRFWRTFEIPSANKVKHARLRITADNFYSVYLDGQQIGQGADWRVLIEYDLTQLLTPGRHVLAVSAFNDFDVAGFLMGLVVEMDDGRMIEIASDASWKISPDPSDDARWMTWTRQAEQWPAAAVVNPFYPMDRPRIYQAPASKRHVVPFWERTWFQIGLAALCITTLLGCVFLLSRLLIQSKLQAVVRRERARIAADLHDDLGGGLTQLVLLGETTRREVPEDSLIATRLNGICDQSRTVLQRMNENIWMINSQRDNVKDVVSYIGKYAESFLQASSVRCRFDIENDFPKDPCDIGVRRNLFLAVKEALNNIVKHAGATEVLLSIHRLRGGLVVGISDNGGGFDLSAADPERSGLKNMRLRAAESGGKFKIESAPGAGCHVEFHVPFAISGRKVRSLLP
ncbi:MAG: ATP-binding protein [Verrucomicrobiota bacterium]